MNTTPLSPNKDIAAAVVTAMTHEKVLSSSRMTTGNQYFVFDIKGSCGRTPKSVSSELSSPSEVLF